VASSTTAVAAAASVPFLIERDEALVVEVADRIA
jgi:hypothetical protein